MRTGDQGDTGGRFHRLPARVARLIWLSFVSSVALACQVDKAGVGVSVDRPDAAAQGGPSGRDDARASDARGSGDAAAADLASSSDASMSDSPLSTDSPVAGADAGADTAAPDSAAPSALPARCDAVTSDPVAFRRLPDGPKSDDIDFDRDGHLVSFDRQDFVRVMRNAPVQLLARNVIGMRGGALRALPDGDVYLADFERDLVVRVRAGEQPRRLEAAVDSPMKMVRGPNDALYISGQDGTIYRLDPASGSVTTAGTTPFKLGGLTFSLDYKTLYVGADPDGVHAMDVHPDGTLASPRSWRSDLDDIEALATDECGNIYAIGENDGRVRRVRPTAQGPGPAELVADLKEPYLWSMAFGSGQQGWSDGSLYVLDAAAGRLFELPVGVGGQPPPSAPAR